MAPAKLDEEELERELELEPSHIASITKNQMTSVKQLMKNVSVVVNLYVGLGFSSGSSSSMGGPEIG